MYFYGFCQTIWLLTGIPLNSIYIYIYISFLKKIIYIWFINSVLLPTSYAAFWKNFTWCFYYPPLDELIFGSWERLDYLNVYHLRITFFYHKSESWKLNTLPYIFILYIFQKFCSLKKLQNTVSTKMFCTC